MAESSARRPGLLRRLLLCPMGLCQTFRPSGDDKALWGECDICERRAGEVSREAVRRYADMKERDLRITAALEAASAETGAFRESCLPPACAAAASLDTLHPDDMPDDEGLAIGSATPAMRKIVRVGEDLMHPAFVEPVSGFMRRSDFEAMQGGTHLGGFVLPYPYRTKRYPFEPADAVVEVEIRLRRVIQEGEA